MTALELFRNHRKNIVDAWVEAVFATYPLETTGFLRTRNDPFTNPVAHMTRQAASTLYDAMIGEEIDQDTVRAAIERFVKLRAVQKFAPASAMAVFYLLKPLLREQALGEMEQAGLLLEYLEAESRLDTLVLLAFDMYAEARETLADTRIKEIRTQYAQLAKWAQKLEKGGDPDRSGGEHQGAADKL